MVLNNDALKRNLQQFLAGTHFDGARYIQFADWLGTVLLPMSMLDTEVVNVQEGCTACSSNVPSGLRYFLHTMDGAAVLAAGVRHENAHVARAGARLIGHVVALPGGVSHLLPPGPDLFYEMLQLAQHSCGLAATSALMALASSVTLHPMLGIHLVDRGLIAVATGRLADPNIYVAKAAAELCVALLAASAQTDTTAGPSLDRGPLFDILQDQLDAFLLAAPWADLCAVAHALLPRAATAASLRPAWRRLRLLQRCRALAAATAAGCADGLCGSSATLDLQIASMVKLLCHIVEAQRSVSLEEPGQLAAFLLEFTAQLLTSPRVAPVLQGLQLVEGCSIAEWGGLQDALAEAMVSWVVGLLCRTVGSPPFPAGIAFTLDAADAASCTAVRQHGFRCAEAVLRHSPGTMPGAARAALVGVALEALAALGAERVADARPPKQRKLNSGLQAPGAGDVSGALAVAEAALAALDVAVRQWGAELSPLAMPAVSQLFDWLNGASMRALSHLLSLLKNLLFGHSASALGAGLRAAQHRLISFISAALSSTLTQWEVLDTVCSFLSTVVDEEGAQELLLEAGVLVDLLQLGRHGGVHEFSQVAALKAAAAICLSANGVRLALDDSCYVSPAAVCVEVMASGAPLQTRYTAATALSSLLQSPHAAFAGWTLDVVCEKFHLLSAALDRAYQHLEVELMPALVDLLHSCWARLQERRPAEAIPMLVAMGAAAILEDEASRIHYGTSGQHHARLHTLARTVLGHASPSCALSGLGPAPDPSPDLGRLLRACAAIAAAGDAPSGPQPDEPFPPDFFASAEDQLDCT